MARVKSVLKEKVHHYAIGTLGVVLLLLILFFGSALGTILAWTYFTPEVTVDCNCGGYSQQGFWMARPPIEVNPENRTDL